MFLEFTVRRIKDLKPCLRNVAKGRKLAWYRNENIRFDVDSIAIENDTQ